MDKVVLDGIEYVKASAVAKQFRYTSDYIGQLCRAKKVDARLVGRTWFVNPDSIKDHKQTTHKKTTPPTPVQSKPHPQDADMASNVKINRVEVIAPLKNKTVKATTQEPAVSSVEIHTTPAISYHEDAETLLPNLNLGSKTKPAHPDEQSKQSAVKRFLHVEPASAKKLKIAKTKQKETSFNPTELPDVALSGKVSVASYEDISTVSNEDKTQSQEVPTEESAEAGTSVPIHQEDALSVSEPELPAVATPEYTRPSVWVRLMPLVATFFATIISFVLLSVTAEVTVHEATSTANLVFELEQFLQLFAR